MTFHVLVLERQSILITYFRLKKKFELLWSQPLARRTFHEQRNSATAQAAYAWKALKSSNGWYGMIFLDVSYFFGHKYQWKLTKRGMSKGSKVSKYLKLVGTFSKNCVLFLFFGVIVFLGQCRFVSLRYFKSWQHGWWSLNTRQPRQNFCQVSIELRACRGRFVSSHLQLIPLKSTVCFRYCMILYLQCR